MRNSKCAEIILQNVCSLVAFIEDLENPFEEKSQFLIPSLLYCKQFVVLRVSVRISLMVSY